jgi:hypothetical protein
MAPQLVDYDQLYPGRFLKSGELLGKKPTADHRRRRARGACRRQGAGGRDEDEGRDLVQGDAQEAGHVQDKRPVSESDVRPHGHGLDRQARHHPSRGVERQGLHPVPRLARHRQGSSTSRSRCRGVARSSKVMKAGTGAKRARAGPGAVPVRRGPRQVRGPGRVAREGRGHAATWTAGGRTTRTRSTPCRAPTSRRCRRSRTGKPARDRARSVGTAGRLAKAQRAELDSEEEIGAMARPSAPPSPKAPRRSRSPTSCAQRSRTAAKRTAPSWRRGGQASTRGSATSTSASGERPTRRPRARAVRTRRSSKSRKHTSRGR